MSRIAEHLADLTVSRDRDLLDGTLVAALRDLLDPLEVGLYRSAGEPGHEVWLTRARLRRGEVAAYADPAWAPPETLLPLHACPERQACLRTLEMAALPGPPACTLLPLGGPAQALGVVELLTERPLARRDLRMLRAVLRLYANFQNVLDYSERDSLTGLLNRKTFDENFMRALGAVLAPAPLPLLAHLPAPLPAHLPAPPRAEPAVAVEQRRQREQAPFWLGLVDIDHFKQVNDVYGHLVGDEVLLLLAGLMRSNFRYHDQLYRFGGEEFVVLMRCRDAEAASVALERLRQTVGAFDFPQAGHITVSIGVTELRASDTPSEAFERADKALYHVKQNGRNQIAHHEMLVAAGLLAEAARATNVEFF